MPGFLGVKRMFGGCSIEIATICVLCKELSSREEVTLDAVMCLVKIDIVHLNICLHDTMERIVCGEDDAVLAHVASTVCIHIDFVSICGAGVVSFTTVNVHHMQIRITVVRINDLHKFAAQLFCQQNTRSNNNSRHAIVTTIHGRLGIHNHSQGFATTSGHNHLTFVVILQAVDDAFLMWAKSDGQLCSVDEYSIRHRDPPGSASVPLVQLSWSSCSLRPF